jgi:histidinol-phosphatase (PHP family)
MMKDYHIHPSYSIDAEGSIDAYCMKALERGIDEICFTTHLDADPHRDDCFVVLDGKRVSVHSAAWFEDYEATIRKAGDDYGERGLDVRMGVEVDLYNGVVDDLPEAFHKTEFDMVVGSVHLIDHLAVSLPDEAAQIFHKYNSQELGELYFGLLTDMIETRLFDILGHLDIYRRYGEDHYDQEIHHLWKPHIDDLTKEMSKLNVGFEINTSAWRKGQKEPMPARPIIEALAERGITRVTVGSDAHTPNDLGYGIDRAYDLLRDCGFETISIFSNRKASIVPI